MRYIVELWDADGQPGWSCTCPYAEDGSLCKHAVAVTLLLDDAERDPLETLCGSRQDSYPTAARQAGQPERFTDIPGRVRAEHGRKRNLIQLSDRKGW